MEEKPSLDLPLLEAAQAMEGALERLVEEANKALQEGRPTDGFRAALRATAESVERL